MRRALVVGGNGFIGSHLVDGLLRRDWSVSVLDLYERRYDAVPEGVQFIRGDLSQSYLVREALSGVDTVFHLAWTTIHEVSNQDPSADVEANLIPSIHLMEACRQSKVRRVVFTSSGGTVYGPTSALPISETHRQNPVNGYGITKLAVEKYLHMFRHLYGLDYAIVRPSVPYGPRQNPLGRQGAIAVFLYRIWRELPLTIWGDGSVTRDYFYVGDLADALIAAAEHTLDGERIFNIGGGSEISLRSLVERIEATVGKQARVAYEDARGFDVPRLCLDTTRAQEVLAWQAHVGLDEGLARTWRWMRRTFES